MRDDISAKSRFLILIVEYALSFFVLRNVLRVLCNVPKAPQSFIRMQQEDICICICINHFSVNRNFYGKESNVSYLLWKRFHSCRQ
jgi:hypothetical protein